MPRPSNNPKANLAERRSCAMSLNTAENTAEASAILVGHFDDFETAGAVSSELLAAGYQPQDIEQFALNAPGQHDANPAGIGGDRVIADPQARGAEGGAMSGAALGGIAGVALGAAAIAVAGPIAAAAGLAAGAYAGSFAGAVRELGDSDTATREVQERPAGVRVAVRVPAERLHGGVLGVFNRHAARSIEEARGTWAEGQWSDFDPVSVPHWIMPPQR
ncbi:MAG: hypothetical protein ABIR52_15070 [Casimicrobiaceae bacterium]